MLFLRVRCLYRQRVNRLGDKVVKPLQRRKPGRPDALAGALLNETMRAGHTRLCGVNTGNKKQAGSMGESCDFNEIRKRVPKKRFSTF